MLEVVIWNDLPLSDRNYLVYSLSYNTHIGNCVCMCVFILQQRPQHITKLIYCSRTVPELEKVSKHLVFSTLYMRVYMRITVIGGSTI